MSVLALSTAALAAPNGAGTSYIPGRTGVRGTVPNPGTQQQELSNITFPAPYNTFEFSVTCAACHGGTVDQQVGHFGVQAGTPMASAARDPVFRANQIATNNILRAVTGEDGAGNMCFRCHSPNGWYSGRFDPTLGGDAEGRTMMHSIVASTDDEGISCEQCHRVAGAVKYKPANLDPLAPVWNMMSGIGGYPGDPGWPHDGAGLVDQAGDPTLHAGAPYGDTTLQYSDGMTVIGPYSGVVLPFFSDQPWSTWGATDYTGQIYAIYPPGDPRAGQPAIAIDGSLAATWDQPVTAPIDYSQSNFNVSPPIIVYDYSAQSISLEHPTAGGPDAFITTSEFCGSCHDLTVPILNHGMPEQRTYTEWKFSAYSKPNASTALGVPVAQGRSQQGEVRCQDCHMPQLRHEYADNAPAAANADPVLTGWYPYTKDRNPTGGTSKHTHAGANRDLGAMMKLLYPQPDLEVIGAPTGVDTRVFPGMLSTRDPMFDRNTRNAELTMADAVLLDVAEPPAEVSAGVYEVKVKVTNRTGHRIPSGYPDGRRLWVSLRVTDPAGSPVYQSGSYDSTDARLYTDASPAKTFRRAQQNLIDATSPSGNAVMVYERVTCRDGLVSGPPLNDGPADGICEDPGTPALLNNRIMFDNRIPPTGFTYADYRLGGTKFWNYTMVPHPGTTDQPQPCEDAPGYSAAPGAFGGSCPGVTAPRYPEGQGFDVITYRFAAPAGLTLSARAEALWQTHTREFMEHLRDQQESLGLTDSVRPEGPLDPLAVGYPFTPSYLSDVIGLASTIDPYRPGTPLRDNWGGIAYAAWLKTGRGAPAVVAAADTRVTTAPPAVTGLGAVPTPGLPFEATISWDAVPGADGYVVSLLFGCPLRPRLTDGSADPTRCFDEAIDGPPTSSNSVSTVGVSTQWDRLAIVRPSQCDASTGVCSLVNTAMNVDRTYGIKVAAFNTRGPGPDSATLSYRTPGALPLAAALLRLVSVTTTTATLAWTDAADNETIFVVQLVPAMAPQPPLSATLTPTNGGTGVVAPPLPELVFVFGTQTPGAMGFGGNQQTISGLSANTAYNVQVQACNAVACSGMNTNGPIQIRTSVGLAAPILNAPVVVGGATLQVSLSWSAVAGATGYVVERSIGGTTWTAFPAVSATSAIDSAVAYGTSYSYRVSATNATSTSSPSNVQTVTTPAILNAPTIGTVSGPTGARVVTIRWTYANQGQTGFAIERAPVTGGVVGAFAQVATAGSAARSVTNTLPAIPATRPTASVYVYRVVALRNTVRSDPSANSTLVTLLPAAASAPSSLSVSVTAGQTGALTIRFRDNAVNESGFTIERQLRNTNGTWGQPTSLALPAGSGIITTADSGLLSARVYRYRVRAYNDRGPSAWTGYQSAQTN